jgi:hypothetical protein
VLEHSAQTKRKKRQNEKRRRGGFRIKVLEGLKIGLGRQERTCLPLFAIVFNLQPVLTLLPWLKFQRGLKGLHGHDHGRGGSIPQPR